MFEKFFGGHGDEKPASNNEENDGNNEGPEMSRRNFLKGSAAFAAAAAASPGALAQEGNFANNNEDITEPFEALRQQVIANAEAYRELLEQIKAQEGDNPEVAERIQTWELLNENFDGKVPVSKENFESLKKFNRRMVEGMSEMAEALKKGQ